MKMLIVTIYPFSIIQMPYSQNSDQKLKKSI